MGLNVGGVDMLRSKRGPVVMEVNSSPGLEGIEKTTGVDVAAAIIDFLEKNAKPGTHQDARARDDSPSRSAISRSHPGTRQTVELPVSVLSNHTPMTLPVHVHPWREAGPGAVHFRRGPWR